MAEPVPGVRGCRRSESYTRFGATGSLRDVSRRTPKIRSDGMREKRTSTSWGVSPIEVAPAPTRIVAVNRESLMLSARQWIGPLVMLSTLAVNSASPTIAFAADIVKFEVDFFGDGGEEPVNHATIWTTGRKIRVDQMQPGGDQNASSLVYRGDQELVISISDRTQSYVKVERRLLIGMQGRVRAGRRTVEEHLKTLPGDQRKGFERLLGVSREDPNATVNPIVVQPVSVVSDRAGEVAGFGCTHKVMRRGVVVIGEACVAPWDRIGMTPGDMEIFRSLANYQRDALGTRQISPLEIVPNQPLDLIVQFGGIPLSFERKIGAQRRSAVRVTSVDWIAEEGSLFEAPANYTLATGYADMLSHLMPSSEPSGKAEAHLAAAVTKPTLSVVAPPAAPAPRTEASLPPRQDVSVASRQAPAARATSQPQRASQGATFAPSRTRALRANPNSRRTVGATRDRQAPVRLFPNR